MRGKRKLWRNRRGQGLTEYALLIALVSLGLILLLGQFRNAIGNTVKNSTVAMNSVANIQQAGGAAGTGGAGGTGFVNGLVNAATAGLNAAAGTIGSPLGAAATGLANLLGNLNIGGII
jgi:Flp pilus assembly pilin Flp